MNKLILASASPRRKDLLSQIGLSFSVMPGNQDENLKENVPEKLVQKLSLIKAEEIWNRLGEESKGCTVIGADTIVYCGGTILGKPGSQSEAEKMLHELQGRAHQVFTGVSLIWENGSYTFYEETKVTVYSMTEEEIKEYVKSGEPMDKAGAYAIQGRGAAYIKGIEGDYNNVVGLPISRLFKEMKERKLI